MEEKNKHNTHTYESYQPNLNQTPISGEKPGKKKRFTKINAWLKSHQKLSLAALVVFLILVGGGLLWMLSSNAFSTNTEPLKAKQPPQKFYSPLTGIEVSEEDSKRPVTGVMIENSPEARPQSGLQEAGVVFESVAEGGITRFLAIFQESRPAMIGPVRSVRPQFASWIAGFDAGLAHVGGSDIPLQKLRSGAIRDLDQFFNPDTYWRSNDRYAPHNVYTSDERLQALNKAKGYTGSTFTSWERTKKEVPSATPNASSIDVPISTGMFAVSYTWDPTTNSYRRSVGGAAHIDREKGQITPKVVIVLQVPHDVIRDSNGYGYPDVNGSGKAWLFQDGTVQEITWSKASDKDQIAFKDAEGKTVKLNAGQTWITAIPSDRTPTWQ